MKLNLSRKGFTLVEIMIVVVIIGLLAALAIPAFKKVRNNAIEKTIINDARQVGSAASQFFTENATNTTTADLLIGNNRFLNQLSAGNRLQEGATSTDAAPATQAALNGISFSSDDTQADSVFTILNANYDPTLSSNANITSTTKGNYTVADHGLVFATASGQLVKQGAQSAILGVIY